MTSVDGRPRGEQPRRQGAGGRLVSSRVLVVTGIALCTYFGFGMVNVVLPPFVTDHFGGSKLTVAVVVGVYSFAAVLARPWAGRLGARQGRRVLMVTGGVIIGVSFLLDAVAPDVVALGALRLVTGTGEGMFYIGSATLVTDLVPAPRRAEAIGYYSVALYLGSGVGPTMGHLLAAWVGIPLVFVVAGGLSGLGALASTRLPSGRPEPEDVALASATGGRLVNRAALVPGMVLFLGIMGLIPFQAYVPLYSRQLHMGGPQYVFLLYSAVICAVRMLGKPIHRVAPLRVATVAMGLIVAGLAIIASVASAVALYLGTAVFAAGASLQFPALMGIALSRAPEHERASVVGTYTACMDLAQGVGGFVLGVPAYIAGYRASFASGSVSALVGLGLFHATGVGRRTAGRLGAAAPGQEGPATAGQTPHG